jgi:hypothetical protein
MLPTGPTLRWAEAVSLSLPPREVVRAVRPRQLPHFLEPEVGSESVDAPAPGTVHGVGSLIHAPSIHTAPYHTVAYRCRSADLGQLQFQENGIAKDDGRPDTHATH